MFTVRTTNADSIHTFRVYPVRGDFHLDYIEYRPAGVVPLPLTLLADDEDPFFSFGSNIQGGIEPDSRYSENPPSAFPKNYQWTEADTPGRMLSFDFREGTQLSLDL